METREIKITSQNLNEITVMRYGEGVVVRTVIPTTDTRTVSYFKKDQVLALFFAILEALQPGR